MFQTTPSAEYYKEIERNLARNGKSTSLTPDELKENFDSSLYKAGYTTYTGYVLTEHDANALNIYTQELNRTRCIATRHYLLDKRHQMFCIIAQEISPSELSRCS